MCTAQPGEPAAAFCSQCRLPYSGRYLAVRLDGRAVCHACVERENIAIDRPNHEKLSDPLIRSGWRRVLMVVLTRPSSLSQEYRGPIGPALRLGLLWTFAGHTLNTAWLMLLQGAALVEALREQSDGQIPESALPWVPWLVMPILVLIRQGLGALLFHAGLRAAGASGEQWRSHARVFSLMSVTMLLSVIPVFGKVLAVIWFCRAGLSYARQSYGLSLWRAFLALFPCFLLLALLDLR